ncbi:hypothetical protein Cantr_07454 [Candida viswanathii]|uniref:Uncharacterized protein n=1 Tax=Candida viswanathii TaxID=5486 RepID=A0A367Y0T6_9ASCO|nr:hypothetical protein Cantr_07454 [Candida viswanathii]
MSLLNHLQPLKSEGSSVKLAVPNRHSYATSISSMNHSNLSPLHFASLRPPNTRSGSSAHYRLSRTNTNVTADNYSTQDSQSIATIDKIPATKPTVTYLDKLWTQIDVLDDVKNMANEVRAKGSFFNDKFNMELDKLKALQEKLLSTMSTQQFNDINNNEHQKQHFYQLNTITPSIHPGDNTIKEEQLTKEDEEAEQELRRKKVVQEKINAFFKHDDKEEDLEFKNQTIYRKENFEEINMYVSQIKKDLKGLGESMKKFDESTREIW